MNWWVVLGVGTGRPPTRWSPSWLLTHSKSGHLGRKRIIFPLSALLFWFLFYFLFLNPRSAPAPAHPPGAQVTVCVLQAAPVRGRPGSGGDSESLPRGPALGPPATCSARARPLLRRPTVCPGLVCEVGMMIAATFQPTSQGCCGDTVISEIVHVVMRREPPASSLQTPNALCSPLLCAPSLPLARALGPASLSLASVSFLLLFHQGASLA